MNKFPETWEELRRVGKQLKAKGHPYGQALGHSFADPVTFAYPLLWSFGGKEVEKDGKTVAIDSKETVAALEFMDDATIECIRQQVKLDLHARAPGLARDYLTDYSVRTADLAALMAAKL